VKVASDVFPEARDGGGIGEVAGEDGRLAAGFLDLVSDCTEALLIAGDDQDVRAEGGEAQGDSFADSARGAGDKGNLGFKRRHLSIFDAEPSECLPISGRN
jgi:hypothetical protein